MDWIKIENGHLEFKNGVIISFTNEWPQLRLKRYNWSTFHLLNIEYEFDRHLGGHVFEVIILCLGLRIRIPVTTDLSKETWKELDASMKELEERLKGRSHLWADKADWKEMRKKKTKKDVVMLYRTRKIAKAHQAVPKKVFCS